jgi:hypothetical protein
MRVLLALALLCAAPARADDVAMQGYAGSVARSGDGTELAVTSPPGGVRRLHRIPDGGAVLAALSRAALSRADVCGPAPMGPGSLAGDSPGGVLSIGPSDATPLARTGCAWDDHIVSL